MADDTVPNPLTESTWRRISATMLEAQREIHAAVDEIHDKLRQRLQVIAIDEATHDDTEET